MYTQNSKFHLFKSYHGYLKFLQLFSLKITKKITDSERTKFKLSFDTIYDLY